MSINLKRKFKLVFIGLLLKSTGVTFLLLNKKVTKEISTGGGFLQRRPLLYTTPPKPERPVKFLLSSQMFRFAACRFSKEPYLHGKNRNIFAMHRIYVKVLQRPHKCAPGNSERGGFACGSKQLSALSVGFFGHLSCRNKKGAKDTNRKIK